MKIVYSQNYQLDRVYRTDLDEEDIAALDRRFRERVINCARFPRFTEGAIALVLAEENGDELTPEAEAYCKELCESFEVEEEDFDLIRVKIGGVSDPFFTEFVISLIKDYLDEYVVPSEYEDMVDETIFLK